MKQKEKKKTCTKNNRTTTEPVVQMLPRFLAKKQVNFYAKQPFLSFHMLFSNAECMKKSYHLRSPKKSYFSFLLYVLGQRPVLSYF